MLIGLQAQAPKLTLALKEEIILRNVVRSTYPRLNDGWQPERLGFLLLLFRCVRLGQILR